MLYNAGKSEQAAEMHFKEQDVSVFQFAKKIFSARRSLYCINSSEKIPTKT